MSTIKKELAAIKRNDKNKDNVSATTFFNNLAFHYSNIARIAKEDAAMYLRISQSHLKKVLEEGNEKV